jgi:hypothetical protein
MRTSSRSDRPVATPADTSPAAADLKRRRFLLGLGVGGAGAATAAVGALPSIAAANPAVPAPEHDGNGYRVTEHVRDYYRTAKL